MYLLSRELGNRLSGALFAGLLFMVFPIHLATTFGRLDLAFTGLLPLALWALHRAMTPSRSRWWSVITAAVLLLALLQHGLLFFLVALSLAFFSVIFLFQSAKEDRKLVWRRLLLVAVSSLLLAGPLLLAMGTASRDPAYLVDMNLASVDFQPDFIEFFLPPPYTRLLGESALQVIYRHNLVNSSIETWIYVTGVGLILSLIALFSRQKKALPWLLYSLLMALLALGPSLQLLGRRQFTEYGLEIILPYAVLTAIPGLEFLRTPGRFMLAGAIGLAIGAAFGLDWLARRFPKAEWPMTALFMFLLLAEMWPQPWPQGGFPELSPFYDQIAGDDEMYGIFDLPLKDRPEQSALDYSSRYQILQMSHGKGIATGYISRPYRTHPVFPCLIPEITALPDVTFNGKPTACWDNTLYDLAANNYRYVVWHKPQAGDLDSWGQEQAGVIVSKLFEGQEPIYEDDLLAAYAVPGIEQIEPQPVIITLDGSWSGREESWRWAASPAVVRFVANRPINLTMTLVPAMFYQPDGEAEGQLTVALGDSWSTKVAISPDVPVSIPLYLEAGVQELTLSLEAGNFRPADQGGSDPRQLSFAIRSMDFMEEFE
jgi:hypothetical protein